MPYKGKRLQFTKSGFVLSVISSLLFSLGLIMIFAGLQGLVDFGTGEARSWSIRAWILLALFLMSSTFFFIRNRWKTRILSFSIMFFPAVIVSFALGSYLGIMDALSGGQFSVGLPWILFDVSMTAVGDLTVGMNIKLIADSIYYLVPSVTFAVMVFQIFYSGEGDEFTKALIEAVVVIIIMWMYSTVSGMPIYI